MIRNCRKLEFRFFVCCTNNNKWWQGVRASVRVCVFVDVPAYQSMEYVTHTQRTTHCLLRRTLRMSDVLVSCLFNFLLMSCLSFVAATADAAALLLLLQLSLLRVLF